MGLFVSPIRPFVLPQRGIAILGVCVWVWVWDGVGGGQGPKTFREPPGARRPIHCSLCISTYPTPIQRLDVTKKLGHLVFHSCFAILMLSFF